MIKNLKKLTILFVLIVGLMSNVLAVNAEEDIESTEDEAIEIVINSEQAEAQNKKKEFTNINQEYYVGEGLNIDTAALADTNNTDPNNARVIQVNSLVNDVIAEAGQQRWYIFGANAGKLTLNLDFKNSSNVDYDLYLYKYDDTNGTINLVDGIETTDNVEHFACMVEDGVYFVFVNGYSGYDAVNPYTLGVVLSVYYDQQEVDDRLHEAHVINDLEFSITGTIDNQFDIDYQKFTITHPGKLYISLSNNGSGKNTYNAKILNAEGIEVGELKQNEKYSITAPLGTYYFKVSCTDFGGDYTSTYTLNGEHRTTAASVEVTHAGDALQPIEDYIGGPYWRVYSDSHVQGRAYDSDGNAMPYADVIIEVGIVRNNLKVRAYGRADSQGYFNIQLNIGDGIGQNATLVQGKFLHRYDIVPVKFFSNNAEVSSDVTHFYHFAYETIL